ncbi:hypothetical protein BC937DRAFT_95649 [Endogone sp. FLAS-F59071]|nr:hypothetical protein BC937DRAFT_95649 [Endogone sp. FLAS-F59071]|eukprot:RUS22875.1 hypothetical protein BC937DRAFT_95649 [Endogone sp. FLAS-F59071]
MVMRIGRPGERDFVSWARTEDEMVAVGYCSRRGVWDNWSVVNYNTSISIFLFSRLLCFIRLFEIIVRLFRKPSGWSNIIMLHELVHISVLPFYPTNFIRTARFDGHYLCKVEGDQGKRVLEDLWAHAMWRKRKGCELAKDAVNIQLLALSIYKTEL